MGARRGPQPIDKTGTRQVMLAGIQDKVAISLFDQGMEALEARGQADFVAAAQLRDAAQWTSAINAMHAELRTMIAAGEDPRRIAAVIRNKQAAEEARRRILGGLLLTPQKKRGRPESPKPERESEENSEDAAWAAFDDDGSEDP